MISSIQGSTVSTGVVTTDASTYKPAIPAGGVSTTSPGPTQNQIGFFGYGFIPGSSSTSFVSVSTPAGLTWSAGPGPTTPLFYAGNGGTGGGSGAAKPDNNGAIFAVAGLGDTPWSSASTPATAATYTPVFTQSPNGPANILSPSFGVTAWIDTTTTGTGGFASVVDYSTSTYVITVHGFSATELITNTIGGSSMVSGATGFGTCTTTSGGTCSTVAAKVPDLGAGPQNVVATGGASGVTVTLTGGATYDPRVDGAGGTSANTALNIVAGNAGSTTILRTGTTFGVHGLYANTAYQIVWNGAGASPIATGTVIGTFTSTATGGIPVPGVQVTVPADISGIHISISKGLQRQEPASCTPTPYRVTGSTLTLVWARLSTPSLETCSSTWAQA